MTDEIQFIRHLLAQRLGDIGELGWGIVEMLVQPLPDLFGAVGRFAPGCQEFGQGRFESKS